MREADGLAMSSRNVHLLPIERAKVLAMLYLALHDLKFTLNTSPYRQLYRSTMAALF